MSLKTFQLSATVSSAAPDRLRAPLDQFLGRNATIEPTADGYKVEATIVGVDAREVNRRLLSTLRKIEKGTKLRSKWTADGLVERFRDFVFVKDGRNG